MQSPERSGARRCLSPWPDEDGASFELECGLHFIEREGLTVGRADYIDVTAEGLGDAGPALAELAGGEHKNAVAWRGEIRDRSLHGTGAGAGQQDHVVGGADELLELCENARVESAKLSRAVVDVGCSHGKLSCGKKRCWTRREEARFANHATYSTEFHSPTSRAATNFMLLLPLPPTRKLLHREVNERWRQLGTGWVRTLW